MQQLTLRADAWRRMGSDDEFLRNRGGKGTLSKVVKFQMRPDPLAN